MRSSAIALQETQAASKAYSLAPLLVWLVPLLYPLAYPAIVQSLEWIHAREMTGIPLFAIGMAWALAGPWAAWLALDYLDRNRLDRRQYRLVVYGALLTAVNPPFYNWLGNILLQFHHEALRLPVWYSVNALVAAASLLPVSEVKVAPDRFRRIHGYSAMLIALFAVAHVFNHSLGIISLNTHYAVLRVLRLIYRERLIEIALVGAVVMQAVTGFTMVWKSRLRRTTTLRNLQTISGLFMVAFFNSHLRGVFSARLRGVDTTFAWATNGPAGILARPGSAGQLPYYILAVVMLFVHLACQARWNLARVTSENTARKISYGLMATGGIAGFVIGLAACGIYLKP